MGRGPVDGRLTGTARTTLIGPMCNLYSITTNQAAIIALFRVSVAEAFSSLEDRKPRHNAGAFLRGNVVTDQ